MSVFALLNIGWPAIHSYSIENDTIMNVNNVIIVWS